MAKDYYDYLEDDEFGERLCALAEPEINKIKSRKEEMSAFGAGRPAGQGEKANSYLVRTRLKLGMTQMQFAKELGVSRSLYSMIECGARDGTEEFWKKVNSYLFPLS